ncbi:MAG: hypothetical protein RL549_1396, partial [Verrucomicrobiota bacterium]
EDLRRIYFQALSTGDEAAQDRALEELMVVNPKNSDYPAWKKLLDGSRQPEIVPGKAGNSSTAVHTNGVGRLALPGKESLYEWDLVMPPDVQGEVLKQLESWRRRCGQGRFPRAKMAGVV